MSAPHALTDRIRAEFTELPGLKITFEQACRLWHVNEAQCRAALESLINEGLLRQSASGAFIALPKPMRKTAKAAMPEALQLTRCPHCQHMNSVPVEPTATGHHLPRIVRCAACSRVMTVRRMSS